MVGIDTVYQRVLTLANKEQRGYITPQEFNLFANQAQLEIVDQYFNDINQFSRIQENDTEYSNMSDVLDEKLGVLKKRTSITTTGGIGPLPLDLYKLGSVFGPYGTFDQVNENELAILNSSYLSKPTPARRVYVLQSDPTGSANNNIKIIPAVGSATISYVKKPQYVKWGYVVISDKALYDPSKTTNFELHSSEETELVYKILKLSGVAIQRQDVAQFAQAMEQSLEQKSKQ
tara:strand:- start:16668 stop:17363 length:696 start_codon:yes stop_codon:yes gene_type:complete